MNAAALKNFAVGAAILGGLGLVAYIFLRGPAKVATDAGKETGKAVVGLAVGAVKGISEGVGIRDTNETKCAKALAEGRYWDASIDCPALDFIGGVIRRDAAPSGTNAAARHYVYGTSEGE